MIEVQESNTGTEVWIKFYRWWICADVKYQGEGIEDVTIFDQSMDDVTEEYLLFGEKLEVNPSGENLFNIMCILKNAWENNK